MTRLIRIAERAIDALAIATFGGMFACVLAQVVFRYFLGEPLTWSDELARYLFVWCAFLGWVVAARRRSHLSVAMVADRLGRRGRAALAIAGAAASVAFAAILGWYGWQIMLRNLDVSTTSLFFAFGVVYAIVPPAALAVALHALSDARAAIRSLRDGGAPAR